MSKPTDTDLLRMILKNNISFDVRYNTDGTDEWVGFCVKTQHVRGNSPREILHSMYDSIRRYADKAEECRRYRTFEDLVNDTSATLQKTNWVATNRTGTCATGYEKKDVLYAREHGVEAYEKKRSADIAESWVRIFGKDELKKRFEDNLRLTK